MESAERQKLCADFLQTHPLYKKLRVKHPGSLMAYVILLWCDECRAERPFEKPLSFSPAHINAAAGTSKAYPTATPEPPQSGFTQHKYRCTLCRKRTFDFWTEFDNTKSWIMKVGQSPAWSIDIPADLEKELGDDAILYKKALMLMSQSYGLGACIYLRRIIENHINPLLELILEIRKSEGMQERVAEVEAALAGRDFASKIKVAAEILPASLIVEGENPVKLIYDKLSVSIHGLTEDKAMDIAMAVRAAFEYVILELRRQVNTKKQFVEAIRALK